MKAMTGTLGSGTPPREPGVLRSRQVRPLRHIPPEPRTERAIGPSKLRRSLDRYSEGRIGAAHRALPCGLSGSHAAGAGDQTEWYRGLDRTGSSL